MKILSGDPGERLNRPESARSAPGGGRRSAHSPRMNERVTSDIFTAAPDRAHRHRGTPSASCLGRLRAERSTSTYPRTTAPTPRPWSPRSRSDRSSPSTPTASAGHRDGLGPGRCRWSAQRLVPADDRCRNRVGVLQIRNPRRDHAAAPAGIVLVASRTLHILPRRGSMNSARSAGTLDQRICPTGLEGPPNGLQQGWQEERNHPRELPTQEDEHAQRPTTRSRT